MDAREHQVVVDAVVEIGAAADDHVARAGRQLLAREVDGRERGSAGGVHRVVRAAEVEPVGDAAGDDVGEDARERVLGQRGQVGLELHGQLAQHLRVGGAKAVRPGELGPGLGAEDDARALPVEDLGVVSVARVVERPARDLEGQKLDGIDGRERARWNPVSHRIEGRVGHEASPLRRRELARALRVVVLLRVPPLGRHLADRVRSRDDVLRDVAVELPHGAAPAPQRGDLTDHVHAALALLGLVHVDDAIAVAA